MSEMRDTLRALAAAPVMKLRVGPRAAAELLRQGWARAVSRPSVLAEHRGRSVPWLEITPAGRQALGEM